LIAQARRGLEVEVRSGFSHLLLEIRDERRQVVGTVTRAGLSDTADLLLLALVPIESRVGYACGEPNLLHALLDADRRDPVLDVVSRLNLAAAVRLLDASLHRAGHLVRVEDCAPIEIARGSSHGL